MTNDSIKLIKEELKRCPEIIDYLREEIKTMDNIHNVRDYSKAQDQAIEMKAQIKASRKIHTILENLIGIQDMSEDESTGSNDFGVEK